MQAGKLQLLLVEIQLPAGNDNRLGPARGRTEVNAKNVETLAIADEVEADFPLSETQEAVLRMPEASDDGCPIDEMLQQESHDDSDILVIEDELDLRRVDPSSRVDTQEKVISVDFQAMLTKMQGGT